MPPTPLTPLRGRCVPLSTAAAVTAAASRWERGQRRLSNSAARLQVQTRLAHAGCEVDPHSGALTPPIHLSTTFERDVDGGYSRGYVYSRSANPTRSLLEKTVASLEDGSEAIAFSSGMAAVNATLHALLRPGSHVALADDCYHGTSTLLSHSLGRWGVDCKRVDMSRPSAVRDAIDGGAALLWCETPSNPMCKLTDVAHVSGLAAAAGIPCVVDATWCTPAIVQPLRLGASLVLHSSTKYLGGHSVASTASGRVFRHGRRLMCFVDGTDLLGGIVVGGEASTELLKAVRAEQQLAGAVPSPFDCWLLLRGLRSLSARMTMHCSNAAAVAGMLHEHPVVEAVHYPGLAVHPQHALATEQMHGGFGGMLSFQVRGGEAAAMAVAAKTKLCTRATSLGGTESLIEHRASIEAMSTTPTSPVNLLRLSVGLEHIDDLLDDLRRALS